MSRRKPRDRQLADFFNIELKPKDPIPENFKISALRTNVPQKTIVNLSDEYFPPLNKPKPISAFKKDFPRLPTISRSLQGSIPDFGSLDELRTAVSCDDLPLTSTLSPLPSSLKLIETDTLRMDECCSFRYDSIIFKDAVPCLGNHLLHEMKCTHLPSKTTSAFKRRFYDLTHKLDHLVSKYESVCKNATVRLDMLNSKDTLQSDRLSRQQSKIQELLDLIVNLTELVMENDAMAALKFNKQRLELDEKSKMIKSLEEEIKFLKRVSSEHKSRLNKNEELRKCVENNKSEFLKSSREKLNPEQILNINSATIESDDASAIDSTLNNVLFSNPDTECECPDEIDNLKEIIEIQSKSLEKKTESKQDLTKELTSFMSQIVQFTEQLKANEGNLASMRIKLTSMEAEIAQKVKFIRVLEEKIKELDENNIDKPNAEISLLQKENNSMKEIITKLEAEIAGLKSTGKSSQTISCCSNDIIECGSHYNNPKVKLESNRRV